MMTLREMFDTVVHHLLNQNEKAVQPSTNDCVYKAENGNKCAVGCLIKDDYYDARFEGVRVASLQDQCLSPQEALLKDALHNSGVPVTSRSIAILDMLQSVHDNYFPKDWENQFKMVEDRVKLYEKEEK